MDNPRRVVVTGIGVISPIGNCLSDFWSALVAGRSGITRITRFDPGDFKTQIAAEVKDFNPNDIIDPREAKRMDLFTQYAVCAADEAMRNSGIDMEHEDPFKAGVIVGSGIGGINVLEQQNEVYRSKGPGRVSAFYISGMIVDIAPGYIAIRHGLMGPNFDTTSACASGTHAIGTAYHTIVRGDADVMLSGGAEGSISPTSLAGFTNIKALSRRNDDPEHASRPFDRDRDGFVMGEGGAVLVLEELGHARARGAEILAEVTGAGFTGDAYHITAPHPEGISAARAMQFAVERSGMNLEDVEYINCHGTSTPTGDVAEVNAIKRAFGDHAYRMSISSNKSMIGHLLGAAGAVEMAATVMTIKNGVIPPTTNIENQDPECDLECTANEPVEKDIRFALSNSFGFGGHNATVAVKKYMGD